MRLRAILLMALPVVILASMGQAQAPAPPASPAMQALVEGRRLLRSNELAAALQQYERAIELARAENNHVVEGIAQRGLAGVLSSQEKHAAAKERLERSVRILEGTDARAELAFALYDLGSVGYFLNDFAVARQHYLRALAIFEALGDVNEQARTYYGLSFVTDFAESVRGLERGYTLAVKSGNLRLQGNILHGWSDDLFVSSRLAQALEKLELAIDRFVAAGDQSRGDLARALTSLGRIHRAHGDYPRALQAYKRAIQIQGALGDRFGVAQSTNAIGVAYQNLGQLEEARTWFERAFELGGQTENPRLIGIVTRSLASVLIETDDLARGVALMERLAREDPSYPDNHRILASGYLKMARYATAVESATMALEKAGSSGVLDQIEGAYMIRARAHEQLGHLDEAIADVRSAIALIERTRTNVVATDAMKRGFGDRHQHRFTAAIRLLNRAGRDREALDTAEQGRARAFADLLASREVSTGSEPETPTVATRGGDATSQPSSLRTARDMESLASAAPLSSTDLIRLAARLRSTIVSYWVAPEETFAWVVSSTGNITATRIQVTERRLSQLVDRTWAMGAAQPRGGEPPNEAPLDSGEAPWQPRVRGAGLLSLGNQAGIALRALYELLIDPIRASLPAEAESLLTIIPHGPLFRLSFAALQSPGGQYLVERHAIHYAPAGVVLQLADRGGSRLGSRKGGYLLVADPQSPPPLPDGRPLPRLPGTKREIARVAALVSSANVTTLSGLHATEDRIRRLASERRILHFATHGVVRGDDPLGSFLALTVGSVSSAGQQAKDSKIVPSDDGRLTASEIYDLRLDADLVVLSACRTGLGAVSGDGVVGLARAFLYAGTPSVVATLWDIADEPSALLMPRLYRSLGTSVDKAQALRIAQIAVLKQLRSRALTVSTPSGSAVLREHPVLWSGFILVGLP